MNRQKAYQRGRWAEKLAALLLRFKGYRILAHRLTTPGGEIDILALRGQTLAIIEVKQRPRHAEAALAITPRQQKRLINAARFVLAQRPELGHHAVRFDALLVNRWGWPYHYPDAWRQT